MTKLDIVKEVAAVTEFDLNAVNAIVETFIDSVKNNVSDGKSIYFRGFGVFAPAERKEKVARDIHRKTSVIIPAHKTPVFKPYPEFKAMVTKKG